MVKNLNIASHTVGPGCPCFIIAEAGVNHNGDIHIARQLVEAASDAGADAIKFQTFTADNLITVDTPKAQYQLQNTGTKETQYDMIRSLELSYDTHKELQDYSKSLDIMFLSSAFDEQSSDFLNSIDIPAFKIPSGEITNLPLLSHIAKYGKPLIVSTGMATIEEVETAVKCIQEAGCDQFVLLHCVSNYPAPAADINLRAMHTMAEAFNTPVGYSDHTLGTSVPIAAVSLGASIIEKHFTLDRNLAGPDHKASLEPLELKDMIEGIRTVESALGDGIKRPTEGELPISELVRKSVVSRLKIEKGTTITQNMLAILRPGYGIPPDMISELIGRTAQIDIPSRTLIEWEMLR